MYISYLKSLSLYAHVYCFVGTHHRELFCEQSSTPIFERMLGGADFSFHLEDDNHLI